MKPRVRRELRSLSLEEEEAFVGSLREMLQAGYHAKSLARAEHLYGRSFRSYQYLSVKHGLASLHPVCDQGHLAANQVVFHRALLLEFEQSLMSIISVKYPNSSLEALPYWDWPRDALRHGGSLDKSSLWRLWGSPYGNPDDKYCAHDPVFRIKIPRVGDLNEALLQEILGPKLGAYFGNSAGLRRSPWNEADCPGIARNPGWIFEKQTPLFALWGRSSNNVYNGLRRSGSLPIGDECLNLESFPAFAACVQGRGYLPGQADFGLHNIPHIFMGTLYDDNYSGGWMTLVFITALVSIFQGVVIGTVLSANALVNRSRSKPSNFMLMALKGFSLKSFAFFVLFQSTLCIAMSQFMVQTILVGPSRVLVLQAIVSTMLSPENKVALNGPAWRDGLTVCPQAGSQQALKCGSQTSLGSSDVNSFGVRFGLETNHDPSRKSCQCESNVKRVNSANRSSLDPSFWQGLAKDFVNLSGLGSFSGSDFWDGSFSSNENFFYPLHAMGDLIHMKWAIRNNADATNDYGGYPRTQSGECPGTALNDVISEELCFTHQDIGLASDNISESDDVLQSAKVFSPSLSKSPRLRCTTIAQILKWTSIGQLLDTQSSAIGQYDSDARPYTYDVLQEKYTWQAQDPIQECPPVHELCSGTGSARRRNSSIQIFGQVYCLNSSNAALVPDRHCFELGRGKPPLPRKLCGCTEETFKQKSLHSREAKTELSMISARLLAFMLFFSSAFFTSGLILLMAFFYCCWHCRPLKLPKQTSKLSLLPNHDGT